MKHINVCLDPAGNGGNPEWTYFSDPVVFLNFVQANTAELKNIIVRGKVADPIYIAAEIIKAFDHANVRLLPEARLFMGANHPDREEARRMLAAERKFQDMNEDTIPF